MENNPSDEPMHMAPDDYLEAIGKPVDEARQAEVARRDSDSEIHGMESRLRELRDELAANPGNADAQAEFDSLNADYQSALVDRLDLPKPPEQ